MQFLSLWFREMDLDFHMFHLAEVVDCLQFAAPVHRQVFAGVRGYSFSKVAEGRISPSWPNGIKSGASVILVMNFIWIMNITNLYFGCCVVEEGNLACSFLHTVCKESKVIHKSRSIDRLHVLFFKTIPNLDICKSVYPLWIQLLIHSNFIWDASSNNFMVLNIWNDEST